LQLTKPRLVIKTSRRILLRFLVKFIGFYFEVRN